MEESIDDRGTGEKNDDEVMGGNEEGVRGKPELRNPEIEPQMPSIIIDESQINSSDSAAQTLGTGALPRLDCIDPALLVLPPSHLDFPSAFASSPTIFDLPALSYPGDSLHAELDARNNLQAPDNALEPCPTLSEAELRSLSNAINSFLASVQAEEEARQEAAMQHQEANVPMGSNTYVSRLRDVELMNSLPRRPPTPHPALEKPLWDVDGMQPPLAPSSNVSDSDGMLAPPE